MSSSVSDYVCSAPIRLYTDLVNQLIPAYAPGVASRSLSVVLDKSVETFRQVLVWVGWGAKFYSAPGCQAALAHRCPFRCQRGRGSESPSDLFAELAIIASNAWVIAPPFRPGSELPSQHTIQTYSVLDCMGVSLLIMVGGASYLTRKAHGRRKLQLGASRQ